MVGLVVVTHGSLGEALVETAETIMGRKIPQVALVSVHWQAPVSDIQRAIRDAIRKVMGPDGVIIVTDMFGGTPSNISLSFLGEGPIAVLTGVNLPMLMVYWNYWETMDYRALAQHMKNRAIASIVCSLDVMPEVHALEKERRP